MVDAQKNGIFCLIIKIPRFKYLTCFYRYRHPTGTVWNVKTDMLIAQGWVKNVCFNVEFNSSKLTQTRSTILSILTHSTVRVACLVYRQKQVF